ncbi:hypothetical protein [Sulfitobacter sp. 1A15106]|uniref:hypothetical protein n=1 Tax=Sulfitobacter sp. 1A15106 TaxID=3368590 RepID=UPI0037477166
MTGSSASSQPALKIKGPDGVIRTPDEHYGTMMDVEQDPTGAWQSIQDQAARISDLEAALDSEHAVVGSNIWRFWAEKARKVAEKLSGARTEALREAAKRAPVLCGTCEGLGELDDADCGDISFRTWVCPACSGSKTVPNPTILALIKGEHP